jgi:hypothetical protein
LATTSVLSFFKKKPKKWRQNRELPPKKIKINKFINLIIFLKKRKKISDKYYPIARGNLQIRADIQRVSKGIPKRLTVLLVPRKESGRVRTGEYIRYPASRCPRSRESFACTVAEVDTRRFSIEGLVSRPRGGDGEDDGG